MNNKHTPGPWQISDDAILDGEEDITIETEDGIVICTVRGSNDMICADEDDLPQINQEVIANARLIAAAPELLEVLKDAYIAMYGGNSTSFEDAVNRIPKNATDFEKKIVAAIKNATS